MSDSDTTDSDCGVRYKTTTTRHKHSSSAGSSSSRNHAERSSYREERLSSSRHSDRRRYRRSRSKSPDRRHHRRRSRSIDSPARSRSKHYTSRSSKNDKSPTKDAPAEKVLDISVSSVSSQDDQPEQQPCAAKNQPFESFGPSLPPSLAKTDIDCKTLGENSEPIGPALPPHLRNAESKVKDDPIDPEPRCIGPALPPGFIASQVTDNEHISSESELSPFSEPEEDDEHDMDDLIGPLPGTSSSRVNVELEQRALELKIRQMEEATAGANGSGSSTVPKAREDWMLELPDIRKISDMGLGARQFRTREKPEIGDRSVWTDTPADRERKKKSTSSERSSKHSDAASERDRERERSLIAKRDKEQEKMVKQHKKKHKRDKTLLEIHQTKLKKDKQEASDSTEPTRRPFDRNLDLHANRFDDAQKKAIMKKAQLLNSRFSSGSSKYL
ncbi:GPALPP motifs-containing protein 1 [Anopheles moucheti]|uniref:GPALPP motifs-containing protein 1 n=1 Tax=Anopheles moucheti TaxID=186751 RepID=UPI0022F12A8C|nr:GPALPP motifs-containing protein 1 [Anopheles moucheti]